MKRFEKQIQQSTLQNEAEVLKELKKTYEKALKDINDKITKLLARPDADMQHVIYQLNYQKALKKEIQSILDVMAAEQFTTISDYLVKCYEEGFVSTIYSLQQQGIPLCFPMDQEAVVDAVLTNSKISNGLYNHLGENIAGLKKTIAAEVSRGISTGVPFSQMAQQISQRMMGTYNNPGGSFAYAMRIARTEGHRIQLQSTMDACIQAKARGADIVKQWDATLDARTRPSHAKIDGEIREIGEKFSNGLMFPGDPSGKAAEVVNCRCGLLERPRWALEGGVVKMDDFHKEIVSFESEKDYQEFKKIFFSPENVRYMKYVNTLEERYGTKDFNKILSKMTDREYKHYSELLEATPMYKKK